VQPARSTHRVCTTVALQQRESIDGTARAKPVVIGFGFPEPDARAGLRGWVWLWMSAEVESFARFDAA